MDTKKIIPVVVFLGFVAGVAGGVASESLVSSHYWAVLAQNSSTQQPVSQEKSYVEESQAIDAIKKAGPSVVSIVANADYSKMNNNLSPSFDYKPRQIGGGSGFIISSDGLVLTNRHVVSRPDVQYVIVTSDGTEYDGEVVSIDSFYDLAALQMVKKGELVKKKEDRTKLSNLPIIEFGDSSALQVGQKVLAIGYALGHYENTVTEGIISAKGREIRANDGTGVGETLTGLLQTDASINPGNSGGALVNLAGQVVGINVAIDATGNGIGFAIPINQAKPVLSDIKKYGRIVRPSLGVRHIILTPQKAQQLDIDVTHGALLVGDETTGEFAVIPGSAADKAGLKMKDVILSVDGKDITIDYTLQDSIMNKQPGDTVDLKVWRSGTTMDVKATLTEAKDKAAALQTNA